MAWDIFLRDYTKRSRIPVLRFYTWPRPTLSLGHSQEADRVVNWPFCLENSIDVVRRPTGGRAILHHRELTYCLTGILGVPPFPSRLQEAYLKISNALVRGLRAIGIPAEVWSSGDAPALSPRAPLPCFTEPGPGEIAVNRKKIVGSAMNIKEDVFLQHGSILMDADLHLQKNSQNFPFNPRISTLRDHRPDITLSSLKTTLREGVESFFQVGFQPFSDLETGERTASREAQSYRIFPD